MEKLLVSTKQSLMAAVGSDAVGSSLPQLLNADYLQQSMNYKVYLTDPFYNACNLLNKFCYEVSDKTSKDIDYFDRVLQPLFCFGDLYDSKNKKRIKVEGVEFLNKDFKYKKRDYQIYQSKGFKIINAMNKSNYFKSFDIPYDMYYSLFEREKFVPSFFLKKNKDLPINKKKNTFSIQIRRSTYKKNLTTILPKLYDEFIINLINKIKKESNNPNIVFYGIDKESLNVDDDILKKKLLDLKCIHLENYSSNPLERAMILGKYTNYMFSQFNGFTMFATYIGQSKNVLKKKFFINSENSLNELHSRRILLDGYLGDTYLINSNFYKGDIYPLDSVLNADFKILNRDKIINVKKLSNIKFKKKEKKKPLLIYDTSDLSKHYFSKEIDNIIFQHLTKDLKLLHKNRKIIKIKKNFNNKKFIQNNLNISTHYGLKKEYEKSERIGLGSYDFLSHPTIEKLRKNRLINASNMLYEDLYSYFVRKTIKPVTTERINISSKRILIIDNPNSINKDREIFSRIKKRLKLMERENDLEDWYKFSEFVNENFSCSTEFLYIEGNKLVYQNHKKNYYKIDENNIKKIIKKYHNIICRPNHLSLLIKFLFPKKNLILYSRKNYNKKVFLDNKLLFYHDNELQYADFFIEKIIVMREIFLYFFKQFKV
jgi:hypothetical protein